MDSPLARFLFLRFPKPMALRLLSTDGITPDREGRITRALDDLVAEGWMRRSASGRYWWL